MRALKSYPFLKLVNSYVIDAPVPSNLNYLWNFGSLLGLCLVIQIVTGVTLAMHYNPSVLEAFNSVEHIMRDVNNGWLVRYLHSNTASAFFFLVYLHMGRGLYYGSYRSPRALTWTIGTIIFLLMIVTGFLGLLNSPKWFKNNNNNNNNNNYNNNLISNSNNNNKYNNLISNSKNNNINYNNKKYSNISYTQKNKPYSSPFSNGGSKREFSIVCKKRNILESPEGNNEENKDYSKEVTLFLKDKNLDPVFVYENLGEDFVKNKIREDTKNLAGVYLILNKFTGDYYVGSASTNRFFKRFSNHLFNKTGSKIVKAAVNKYKIFNFAFIILEVFPEIINKENNKNLLNLEDFYLKSLLPNYNILTEAGSSFGYKHTEITRINMKSNYSEERRMFIGNLNKGKFFTDDERKKYSLAALNRKKAIYSEQAILNIKKASKPIIVYNFDGTVYGEFASIVEGAKALNCSEKTINRALQTPKQILRRRWIVKFSNI
jgi:group I intron endonuclease